MFGRMMNQLGAATTTSTGPSSTSTSAASSFLRLGGYGGPSGALPGLQISEEPVREEDGQLSIDIAEKMLKWHAEAIGRCVELSSASDV
jgi:hypothetical protein